MLQASRRHDPLLQTSKVSFSYQYKTFVNFVRPSFSLGSSLPFLWFDLTVQVPQTPSLHLGTSTKEFCTFYHIEPHTMPYQYLSDNYCCRWTPPKATLHPIQLDDPTHMSSTSLLVTELFSLIAHMFEDDRQNSSSNYCPKHLARSARI